MAVRAYQPPKNLAGERLDNVLSRLDDAYSRSSWQKLIKLAAVKVNGTTERDPAARYSGGLIEFDPPELMGEAPEVPVLYEDDDVMVYDKPAGLLTHAKGQLTEEWTLADIAAPKIDDGSSNRAGIVHRLDRDTSGVIIVAKHAQARTALQRQFSERKVSKTYQALVEGVIKDDEMTLDWPIGRHPAKPSTWSVDPNGKPALTKLKVLKHLAGATLVELSPQTGRTHQLRVHLQKAGHPIVGDRLYGRAEPGARLMLHAQRLELVLPSGQKRQFEAPLPDDFANVVDSYEQ